MGSAMPQQVPHRPSRRASRLAPLAAALVVAITLFAAVRGPQAGASSPVQPPAAPVTAAALASSPVTGRQRAGERAEYVAAEQEARRVAGGGGARGGGAPSADNGESHAARDPKPKPASAQAAAQAAPQPAAVKQAAANAASAAQPAAPAASPTAAAGDGGGEAPQLDTVPAVDIGAKANRYLGFQLLLRSAVTPFNKCRVTSYQPKPLNDPQVTAVLQDSSKLAGQLFWAEVGSVPCRKDGTAGCCKQLFSFRYGTTDILVFQQIFRDHFLRALYSLFPEDAAPKYILDAGANAGYATSLFKLLWPDAVVVSLEPDPGNFAAMRRNTAGFSGVHRLNAGLWGRQANITLSSNGCLGCEWGKTFRETTPGETGVPAYSVNDVARMFNIPAFDFVKIDIEGAEGRVFAPGSDLSWLGAPRVVSLEIHDFFAQQFGLTAVSGHVDAAFQPHPRYQIARDNEHVFYIDKDHLAAARLSGGTAAAARKP